MDDALENKICDLYDLYVEVIYRFSYSLMEFSGLYTYISALPQPFNFQRHEEDSGPPVRRLYEEVTT